MVDCEKFVLGSQEINRKRKVITIVITTVQSLMKRTNIRWKFHEVVFEISLDQSIVFQLLAGKARGQVNVWLEHRQNYWWREKAESIPFWAVPIVFSNLSEIVEKVDSKFPDAEIIDHFQFFVQQA